MMHTIDSTGLQQGTQQRRKALFLLIALALFLSALLTLLSTTPTLASPTQQRQAHIPHAPCPPGQRADVSGTCVTDPTLPTVTATPNVQNPQRIQNPLAKGSPLLFYTDLGNTINQPQVQSLWTVSIWVVDILLALTLATNGIAIMLGGSVMRNAKVIESLPGVLLALIAAHVSMVFMSVFINLNNVISVDFYTYADTHLAAPAQQHHIVHLVDCTVDANTAGASYSCTYPDGHRQSFSRDTFFSTAFSCVVTGRTGGGHGGAGGADRWDCDHNEVITGQAFQITPPDLNIGKINIPQSLGNMRDALKLMLTVTALMLLAQVIVRLFYLDLYIVLAPLGIAAWALPGRVGQPLTRAWFQGFLSTVFVQFLQVVAIIVTQLLLGTLGTYLSTGGGRITNDVLRTEDLIQIINIAFLWFIMRVPALLNAAPMRGMMEVGQTMSQATNSMISMQIMQQQLAASEAMGWGSTGIGAGIGVLTSL